MTITLAVLLGFALDWLLGDPKKLPHPVCAVGKLISGTEKVLRRIFPATPASLTFAGIVLWLITCGVNFAVPFFLLRWLYHVNFWLGFAAETLLCWMIFARKSLADAGYHVYGAVKQSLEEGRKAIAWYVGRDTAELSEEGVIKAAVETVAENLTDGVVSPLVFMLPQQAQLVHDPLNAFMIDLMTAAQKRLMHPPYTVSSLVFGKNGRFFQLYPCQTVCTVYDRRCRHAAPR